MKKLSIQHAMLLANKKNGKCLSKKYIDSKTNLTWQCNLGHIWEAPITSIKRGHWCSKCCNKKPKKFTLNDIKVLANSKNGECVSETYSKTTDVLKWKCENNHMWYATFHDIKKGSWCPICANFNLTKYSIEYCNEIASNNFGKCLSEVYVNVKTKLKWQCEMGHIWESTLGNIKDNGSWCPFCVQSYGESKFRQTLEAITGKLFPKVRPSWLLNENGNRMEIDGFCSELMLGFEYQGRQHIEYITYWHKRIEKFLQQQKSDELKKKILDQRGIKMMYPDTKLKAVDFESYIRKNL